MAPRKKKTEPAPEGQQLDIEQAIDSVETPFATLAKITPEALIKEFLTLKSHAESEGKRFAEYIKPTADRMNLIKASLHARALAGKVNGFPTDEGTAYLSEIVSHRIDPESRYQTADGRVSTGRDALLDWLLDNWDEYGSEGIQLNVSKAIVEKWMEHTTDEDHKDGAPPPGLKIEKFKQLNIKRS
jgi:hypothetical protein